MRKLAILIMTMQLSGAYGQTLNQKVDTTSIDFKIMLLIRNGLDLSKSQYDSVLFVNQELSKKKQALWFIGLDNSTLRKEIQLIENTRDSLYMNILPLDKYLKYVEKKVEYVQGK